MILFNLLCGQEHEFEAWFRDGAAYDAQAAVGEIACPVCGDSSVRKAPMAPNLASRTDSKNMAAELRKALAGLRQRVETTCDYVGDRFSDEARRMHYGETEKRSIYGDATPDEARELREEGVDVMAIPWLPHQDS
jgi:hypothetical protein